MSRTWFALSLLFLFSCKKEENLPSEELKGILLNNFTGQPIPNQPIELEVLRRVITKQVSPEFPNGIPANESKKYYTWTDGNGRYAFSFKVYPGSWFQVNIPKTTGLSRTSAEPLFLLYDDMSLIREVLRSFYDTLTAERSAYVRYHLSHSTGFGSDQLYLNTFYHTKDNRDRYPLNGLPVRFTEYNLIFYGITNQVITDTIPGESVSNVPIQWLHFLNDTIQYKKEFIPVHPGSLSDYQINY
jgi:hypothetical protein